MQKLPRKQAVNLKFAATLSYKNMENDCSIRVKTQVIRIHCLVCSGMCPQWSALARKIAPHSCQNNHHYHLQIYLKLMKLKAIHIFLKLAPATATTNLNLGHISVCLCHIKPSVKPSMELYNHQWSMASIHQVVDWSNMIYTQGL